MIGKLKGIVDETGEGHAILDVGGVGYLVHAPARTLRALPPAGQAATLRIETHVREDHIQLFGFESEADREWFRLLQTVQGVGTRVALAILSALTPDRLASAVAARDKAAFRQVSGIGPKLAERIVTELKDKHVGGAVAELPVTGATESHAALPDAVSALLHLGYARGDALAAASRVAQRDRHATLETLIRGALKELAA